MRLPMASQLHSWQMENRIKDIHPVIVKVANRVSRVDERILHLVHQGLAKVLTGLRARILLELWPELPMHQSIVEYI